MDNIKRGKFMAKVRNMRHMTQEEVGNALGVTSKTVSKWECANNVPDFDTMGKICDVLGITLYELYRCKIEKNKFLREFFKDRITSVKDYLKYSLIYKSIILFITLIGLILGLSFIYMVDNYNKVHVYTFRSLDNNFSIVGNLTIAKDYNIFNVISIGLPDTSSIDLDIDVYDVEYEILEDERRIAYYRDNNSDKKEHQKFNLLEKIERESFSCNMFQNKINNKNNLILRIFYKLENNLVEKVDFKFKIKEKFSNTL